MNTSNRKIEQFKICAEKEVESKYSFFDDVHLIHVAIPEINKDDIDLGINLLGKEFSMPMLIASMTGGHPETREINAALAKAAEMTQIGMGVGSQRAAIEDPKQADSFEVVRENAPSAFIYANLGIGQLHEYTMGDVERAIEMIDADAIAIHLNFMQEAIQPEGEGNADARGCIETLSELCRSIKVPVIAKETGAGISYSVACKLKDAGISVIDVGGLGGTSFTRVEAYRDKARDKICEAFCDWGIPTPVSIVECSSLDIPIIATGGIRTGVDIAKSVKLGAAVCGAALPFVRPVLKGADEVIDKIEMMREELKVAMFLSGCENIDELRKAKVAICGRTRELIDQIHGH
jgi:isopentenyl-diphosphate delta-isomerase